MFVAKLEVTGWAGHKLQLHCSNDQRRIQDLHVQEVPLLIGPKIKSKKQKIKYIFSEMKF